MKGKILEMNPTNASVLLENGTTIDVQTSHIPAGSRVGSEVNLDFSNESALNGQNFMNDKISNEKLVDFF